MENKTLKKLQSILSEQDMSRALNSIQLFCETYAAPYVNNDAINALISFALDTHYLPDTLELLNVNGLDEQALQILFREYYKVFNKQVGSFIPFFYGDDEKYYASIQRQAQSCFAGKDSNAIASWIYIKVCWFSEKYDSQEIERTIFLLDAEKENLRFGGLRSIGLSFDISQKLLPLANNIGALLSTIHDANMTATGKAFSNSLEEKDSSAEEFISSVDNTEPEGKEEEMSEEKSEPEITVAIDPSLDVIVRSFQEFVQRTYGVQMEIYIK